MEDKQLEKAYKMVFDDMKKNAPPFFFGTRSTRGSQKDLYMEGVQIVMKYISLWASPTTETYESYSIEFEKNMGKK